MVGFPGELGKALSTYCLLTCLSARKVEDPQRFRYLRSSEPCHFLPALEALDHLFSIGPGGEAVASRAEMLGNGTIRGEESLGVPRGFEGLHPPLPLPGGLVRILRAVIEVPVLAVLHPRQQLLLRGTIAFQLVGRIFPLSLGKLSRIT